MALLVLARAWPAVAQNEVARSRDQCTASGHFLAPGCRTFELSGLYFVEAWDFNGRPEPDRLGGVAAAVSFTVRDGLGAVIEMLGMRVTQPPPSAAVGGLSGLLRKRLLEGRRTAVFVEGGLGASYATVIVPDRGTQFNYLLQGGGGVTHRLGPRTSLILNLRLFHLSNSSLNGPDHNPDIEAFGGHAGILISF